MSTSEEGASGHNSSTMGSSTTTFHDDGEVVTKAFKPTSSDIPIPMIVSDIRSFFRREVEVFNSSWGTAVTANTSLYSVDVSTLIATNPIYADKLEGYGLTRGTACFKTVINATPFHAGKLVNFWLPMAAQASGPAYKALHNTTLTCRMQLPHVELDCRESSSVFKIPYMSPANWYAVKADAQWPSYGWGQYDLVVLAPLTVGSAADQSITVSIWVWFEDMEFAQPLVPQMSGAGGKKRGLRTFGKSVTQVEADDAGVGKISGGLRSISVAADALASIPMLAPIAGPAAWVADIGAGIASAFGWAKPPVASAPEVMVQQFNRYLANSDGIDSAVPLALISNHAVTPDTGLSVRGEDEMSWAFLKSIETVTNADTANALIWNGTTHTAGTNIFTYKFLPVNNGTVVAGGFFSSHSKTTGGHTVVYNCGTPAFYLANKFKHYRGSPKLRMKVVKTDFHTGRLAVIWTPGHKIAVTPTLTNSHFALREIVDLRDGNEFCFTLPWMIESNYLNVTQYMGQVDIIVQNMLVAPDSCANSVQILLYWSVAEDFELALPTSESIYGYTSVPFSPEMNSSTTGVERVACEVMGGVSESPFRHAAAEQSMGEIFTDIKQLIGRYNRVCLQVLNGAPVFSATNNQLFIWPWFCSVAYLSAGGSVATTNSGGDAWSYVAPMFAFYKGDMRIAITQNAGTASNNAIQAVIYPAALPQSSAQQAISTMLTVTTIMDNTHGPLAPSVNQDWTRQAVSGFTFSHLCSGLGVAISNVGIGFSNWRVPYYNPFKGSALFPATSAGEIPVDQSQPTGALILSGAAGTWTDYNLFRSASDETHLYFFLGAPPIMYSYA
nr:MAG: putative capsid protein [Tombusviridae sp.]